MKNYVAEIAKMLGVEIGEKFYICRNIEVVDCVGQYFLDKDDVLVKENYDKLTYNNADAFEKLLTGYYVACKFDDEKGFSVIRGAC